MGDMTYKLSVQRFLHHPPPPQPPQPLRQMIYVTSCAIWPQMELYGQQSTTALVTRFATALPWNKFPALTDSVSVTSSISLFSRQWKTPVLMKTLLIVIYYV